MSADPRADFARRYTFWTAGLRHYLAMRRDIERGEAGLAACSAVSLVRTMRPHLPTR